MQFDCLRRYSPLGFTILLEGEGGAPGSGGTPPEGTPPVDNGFPANTPVDDMTDKEQAAYWKFHSRKHERVAESRKDFDKFKGDSAELATLKAANATDAEKALDEARRQGENLGAEKHLKSAVEGHLRGETGKSLEDVQAALKFVDVSTFLDAQGSLDASLIKEFAQTLGTSGAQDPNGQQQQQQRPAGGGIRQELNRGGAGGGKQRTSGSLAERTKARRAELAPTPTS